MEEILLAQASTDVLSGLGTAGYAAGYTTATPLTTIVANIINVVLGLTGIAFVILLVYAGILYLTAQGEEGNVKKAKKLISGAVIGIIIIVSAYAIANYLFVALAAAT